MFRSFKKIPLLILPLLAPSISYCEDVREDMRSVYSAFEKLQGYIANPQAFEDLKNHDEILALLRTISDNFKKVDHQESRFKGEVGFEPTLQLVQDILNDAIKRFEEGKAFYTLWRMRGLSNNCVSCHATHNVALHFESKDNLASNLTSLERGNFYLATRQFDKAQAAFVEALKSKDSSADNLEVLRKWLIVETRVKPKPEHARIALQGYLRELKLTAYEKAEIERWIKSFKGWEESKEGAPNFAQAQRLIRKSISMDPLNPWTDEVTLLRATAQMQSVMPTLKRAEYSQALYLLGASYVKLSAYFVDELPEFYLRLCIDLSPGSDEAKAAFKLYEDSVTAAFSGSHGTHIPSDIKVTLMELYKKAYGIPVFDGKI